MFRLELLLSHDNPLLDCGKLVLTPATVTRLYLTRWNPLRRWAWRCSRRLLRLHDRNNRRGGNSPLTLLLSNHTHIGVRPAYVSAIGELTLHHCLAGQYGRITVDPHHHVLRLDRLQDGAIRRRSSFLNAPTRVHENIVV